MPKSDPVLVPPIEYLGRQARTKAALLLVHWRPCHVGLQKLVSYLAGLLGASPGFGTGGSITRLAFPTGHTLKIGDD